jgi:hypothetical protein
MISFALQEGFSNGGNPARLPQSFKSTATFLSGLATG